MKNIIKQIKQIFIDNKDYFIKCTLMSIIAALIIGLSIGLSVPVSAEDSTTKIITKGTYRFNAVLSAPSTGLEQIIAFDVSLNIASVGEVNADCSKIKVVKTEVYNAPNMQFYIMSTTPDVGLSADGAYSTVYFAEGDEWAPSIGGSQLQTITIPTDQTVSDEFATWFEANTEPLNLTQNTITAGTYFGVEVPSPGSFNVSFSFTSDSYEFDTFYVGSDYITYRMLFGDVRSVNAFNFASELWFINFETITVSTDQTLPADFVTWFNSNYTKQITPDPEPTYTISAGYFKARDSFSTSGWNVSNDSIRIRYYNDAANVQAYEVVDGISFISYYTDSGVHYASEIYYADSDVFTDSWNIDGAKNIQVLQDITVDSDFYTVFNSVYAPSSESSNEFDSGYAAGYTDGFSNGRDEGYRQGYAQGLEDGGTNIFTDIIGGVLGAVDSFIIFGGFSLLDLITTLLGGLALVWILKLLAGG